MNESQIRHEHPLQFVQCMGFLSEYVCTRCNEAFYQNEDGCQ